MGAKIRAFFEDENKQLLQLIDAELQKVQANPPEQGPPKRTLRMERLRRAKQSAAGGDNGAAGGGNAGDSSLDRAFYTRVLYCRFKAN